MNTLFSNKAKNSILLKMFFSLTAYVQTSIIFHCDEKEFWDIRLSTQPTKLQVFNFYFSVYAGRSGFCHCKKKEVTLTFIIKRRPSICLSALIYTQLRRKKKHHQETQNGYLAPNIRKRLNLFSYIPRWPPIANTFPVIITGHQQSFVLFRPGPWVSHFIPTWTVEADKKMNLKV